MTYQDLIDFLENKMRLSHIHLIPRRDGDTPNSTGGVRGVIPDKMCYCLDD